MLLFSMDFSVTELFGVRATGCKILFEKASLGFPNCLCILIPNFSEKLHIAWAIRCYCSTPQDVFVLVKGSQVWSEPRAISVLSAIIFERGMPI